ncbi:uncharacterized protein [Equus asinus]|uniref:uncharacterized protein n=1 Tax=Equus asinus TaxID=9793 RepID=UPI0038F60E56
MAETSVEFQVAIYGQPDFFRQQGNEVQWMESLGRVCSREPDRSPVTRARGALAGRPLSLPAPPPARGTTRPPGSGAAAPNDPGQGSPRPPVTSLLELISTLPPLSFVRRRSIRLSLSVRRWRGLIAGLGQTRAPGSDKTRRRESEGSEGRRPRQATACSSARRCTCCLCCRRWSSAPGILLLPVRIQKNRMSFVPIVATRKTDKIN